MENFESIQGILIGLAFILVFALGGVFMEKRKTQSWKEAFREVFFSVTFWGMIAMILIAVLIWILAN